MVELPVCNVRLWLPLDFKVTSPLPLPIWRLPLISTWPLVALVIVSSFDNIKPVAPVISILVLAVIVVKAPVLAEFAPIGVPSIAPESIFALVNAWLF